MSRALLRAVFLALLVAGLATPGRAQTAADSAWDRGDHETAARLYALRLEADSSDTRAMHRLAIMHAWAGRYDQSLALFDRLLAVQPDNLEAALDRARTLAWQGDPRAAAAATSKILDRHPGSLPALKALGQFASWGGEFEVAVLAYDRALEVTPDDRSLNRDRARVLSWASRFEEAASAYQRLLTEDPSDLEAVLGLAQVLAWGGRFDSAEAVYRRVLSQYPDNVEARRGLARALSWSGDLLPAEREWRHLLERRPEDVAALVGLSQTLRWQARPGDGFDLIERAHRLAPNDPEVRSERTWTMAALAPQFAPAVVYESDSDGNRITTTVVRGGWHPGPRLNVSAEGLFRSAVEDSLSRESRRLLVAVRAHAGPGWAFTVGAGASRSDAPGAAAVPAFRAEVASPPQLRGAASLAFRTGALDATAQIIQNDVELSEWSLSGRFDPARRWSVLGALAGARYSGTAPNSRLGGYLGATRRIGRPWTLGATAIAFGFEQDLDDGYFDPDFYALVEVGARWLREFGSWVLVAEVAPGVQRIGSGGDLDTAARGLARIAYLVGPGREVGLSGAFSSTGLQSFSTGAADYRYRQLVASGAWAF